MTEKRDWQRNRDMWIRVLEKQTGEGVDAWKSRIASQGLRTESSLRAWLSKQGVTGYAQSLLVMEQFGYPDFLLGTADQLIERQYGDRPQLRPIYEAIIERAEKVGEVTIQARKTYVSLVSPRRTFARVLPTTRTRVDLGLRLDGIKPGRRLQPSKIHETMRLQISLTRREEVDSEVARWLRRRTQKTLDEASRISAGNGPVEVPARLPYFPGCEARVCDMHHRRRQACIHALDRHDGSGT